MNVPLPWPFDREYMQLALLAAVVVGTCAPLVGIFLVHKRLSLMGDGIGHVAFAGVSAGLLFGVWPIWTALAAAVAAAVLEHPEEALRAHAQEELGVDPYEHPSPWTAGILSFVTFAVGALIPLITYFAGLTSLWPALAVGGAGLFALGAMVTRWTHHRWWYSGLRQLALGAAAAGVTYLVGSLIGVNGAL